MSNLPLRTRRPSNLADLFSVPFFDSPWMDSTTNTSELYRSEDGKSFILKVLLPGFKKEEVSVEVVKNHILVEATRRQEVPEGFVVYRSAFPDKLSYREQIPASLDATSAEAELVEGVLTVKVATVSKEHKGNVVVR